MEFSILTNLFRLNYLSQIGAAPRIIGLVWAASKWYTIAWAVILVLQGLLPAAMVFLSRLLVDSLVDVLGAGASWESARPLLVYGGLMAAIILLTEILGSVMEWVRTAQAQLLQDHISELLHEKSSTVDLAFYESPDYHDRLDRARSEANDRSLALLESTGSLLQNGITLLAMASMLLPYGLWVPAVLIVSTFPAFFVVIKFNRYYHKWWERTTSDRRWAKYYDWILTFSGYAQEMRLFNLGSHFASNFQVLRRKLRGEQIHLIKMQSLARFGAGLLGILIGAAAMAWMVWRALSGSVTLGDLVLFYQAFNRGQTLMRSLLSHIGSIYSNSLFIGNLFEFLDLKSRIVDPPQPARMPSRPMEAIRFQDVTFSYPCSARPALNNFDLVVPAGNVVAIVGANGAGKSTLLKLLCRFYDPDSGAVNIDGIDLRELSMEELRQHISVVFQFASPFHATASENISLGDYARSPSHSQIESAARGAGAHEFISRLPNGYDTLLGKWFVDGSELSGGEWQRLALARAFVREAPIIVLDEPTSFMDSWTEIEWMERFRTMAQGRTAIIITHRFTTAMRADTIHVMDNGRIVESGGHNELLELGGMYAKSWTAQMNVEPQVLEPALSSPFAQNGSHSPAS